MHLGDRTEEVLDAATEVLHGRIDQHHREHGPHFHGYTFVEVTEEEAAEVGNRRVRPGVPLDPPVDLRRAPAGPLSAGPPPEKPPTALLPHPTWPQMEAALQAARQAERDAKARREQLWQAFDEFAAANQPLGDAAARWERMIAHKRQQEHEVQEWWAEIEEERQEAAERQAREEEQRRRAWEARRAAEEDERQLREARHRWQESRRRADEAEFGDVRSRPSGGVDNPPYTGTPRHCAVCNYPGVRRPRHCPNIAEHPRDRMP